MRSPVLALLVAVVLLAPGPGLADAPDDKARANLLFKEGNACFAGKDYYCALEKFRQARVLYPSYKIDLNIGSALVALERPAEAATSYHRFIARADDPVPAEMLRAAREQLQALYARIAVVELRCPVQGAGVMVDGGFVGMTPLKEPLFLMPGLHRVVVQHQGGGSFSQSRELVAGQRLVLEARLQLLPGSEEGAAAGQGEEGGTTWRDLTIGAWATLGAGVALALTSGVLFGVGMSQGEEAHELYLAAPADLERHQADLDAAEEKLTAGWVVGGGALLSLGAALVLFLVRPAAPEGQAVRLGPDGLRGTF